MLPFGPWLPDLPDFRPEKCSDVLNVIPHGHGYHAWPSFNKVIGAPASGQIPLTMQYYIAPSGVIYNLMGTQGKLYKENSLGTGWDIATRLVGGDYLTPSEGFWSQTQFDDEVFWGNGVDVTQHINLVGGNNFIDVAYPVGPPIAKYLGTVRRFVVAANTPTNNREVHWSGLAEPFLWTPDPVTLADSQILPTGGEITGFVGGEYGIVLQQHALQRMVFAGPPIAFEFEKITTVLGCNASRSIAQYGDVLFFLSTSGVKMMRGAQEISDIGEGKVDAWILEGIDNADLWRCTATIDIVNKLYLLAVPIDNAATLCDLILAYHWPTGEWSKIGILTYLIAQHVSQVSYNLDNIDTILPIVNNLDSMTSSLDDPSLISTGDMGIAAFNENKELGNFNGELMPATITTGIIPLAQGKKSLLRSARPMFEHEVVGLTLTPYVTDQLQIDPVATPTAQVNRNGLCPVRANGRYHQLKVDTAAGGNWHHALGIDDIVISEMAK